MKPVSPFDLLNKSNWTDGEMRDARLAICGDCDKFSDKKFCGICHCYMPAKAMLKEAFCPLRRW